MILEIKTTDNLINFIYSKLGYTITDFTENFDKTGVDGIDAETFFREFGNEFEVNMSGFDFDRYFSNENPFINLFRNLFKYWGKRKNFTFNHLIDVIENKKWFNPDDG